MLYRSLLRQACRNLFRESAAFPVTAAYTNGVCFWRNQPAPVFGAAQQRGKTGRGMEAGKTEPIDGAVRAGERRARAVPDDRVILNRQRHAVYPLVGLQLCRRSPEVRVPAERVNIKVRASQCIGKWSSRIRSRSLRRANFSRPPFPLLR